MATTINAGQDNYNLPYHLSHDRFRALSPTARKIAEEARTYGLVIIDPEAV